MNEEQYKEFMLQQQAQSAARVAKLEELIAEFELATRKRLETFEDGSDRHKDGERINNLASVFERNDSGRARPES